MVVDTLGFLLAVKDRDPADDAVTSSMGDSPSMNTLFVDSAYAGKWAQRKQEIHTLQVQVIRGPNNLRAGK